LFNGKQPAECTELKVADYMRSAAQCEGPKGIIKSFTPSQQLSAKTLVIQEHHYNF